MNHIVLVNHEWPFPPRAGGHVVDLINLAGLAAHREFSLTAFYMAERHEPRAVCLPQECTGRVVVRRINIIDRYARHGLANLLRMLASLVFSAFPRRCHFIPHGLMARLLRRRHARGKLDLVIIEHLASAAVVFHREFPPVPVIYIAHNCESVLQRDRIAALGETARSSRVARVLARIDAGKIAVLERRILTRAEHSIFLTHADADRMRHLSRATSVCPPTIAARQKSWTWNGQRQLLFVGSAGFGPNREAIGWIATVLSPLLAAAAPQLHIAIAGTASQQVPADWRCDNIRYCGFVSNEELDRLHYDSLAFLCPIELGSGIKVKLLAAAAYGLPIVASAKALIGLEHFGIEPLLDRTDLIGTVRRLCTRLSDAAFLAEESARLSQAVAAAQRARGGELARIVHETFDRHHRPVISGREAGVAS